jgi:Fe-S oxidoreductase
MRISQEETIDSCRFCFMCRHVCSLARATHEEAVTPRSQGLVMSLINRGAAEFDPDVIQNIYDCTQCRWCKEWCEAGWDFSACIIAARQTLLAENRVPEAIKEKLEAFRNVKPTAKKTNCLVLAELGWVNGAVSQTDQVVAILEKAGSDAAATTAPSSALPLYLLGDKEAATEHFNDLVRLVNETGCQTVVTVSPGDDYVLKEFPELLGVPGLPDSVAVVSMTERFKQELEEGGLELKQLSEKITWHDDDISARYTHKTDALPSVLKRIPGATVVETVWRGHHAHSTGGASFGTSDPDVIETLAEMRIKELKATGADRVITMTADDAQLLKKAAAGSIAVQTLSDCLASLL